MARKTAKVQETTEEEEEELLLDYDENAEEIGEAGEQAEADKVKGNYAGVQSSGFSDFFLKPELLNAISDCGFEHPSEVQQECIPNALLGLDILCQAKSGMGKTAVFTLATLQQLPVYDGNVTVLVVCHTRELAFQIASEYSRFSKYMTPEKGCETEARTVVVFGGVPKERQKQLLLTKRPNIIVGTPGRLKDLIDDGTISLDHIKHFVVDECDSVLDSSKMRSDISGFFVKCPRKKQVMMFTATLSQEMREMAMKYMESPQLVLVDDESRLTLHGLQQYYIDIKDDEEKEKRLIGLLDALEYNQIVIFVRSKHRAIKLNQALQKHKYPSTAVHGAMAQEDRLSEYHSFKTFKSRILISTDVFGRGVDFERVNIVVNYDMPRDADSYLHRVGRAGRFGTKGLAISYVTSSEDKEVLAKVQDRFEVKVETLPEEIDPSTYMNA
ncbi:DEAD/DEAH box helicase [Carpediemonas membranifera]|uniref:RNA helicase n=1 Tax=Carpediemonas membranifera TaxID=201153 RepID=A0A8J6ATD1_9EUKA|nr:DEAD/DEAH box helicase [Carpediemonas membranifera]|eukprot:KAG9394081.1 DEAD/DEAH box helicase [Carpediemonas membranifera]